MIKSKIICDLCKKEVETPYYGDANFEHVQIRIGNYNKAEHDLCPECLEKHGIIKKDKKVANLSEPTIAEQLYEIIAQIVAENQES